MSNKRISVEINGVFYKTMSCAKRKLQYNWHTIKQRCLSNKFPNYKIVPFRITYAEKRCTVCKEVKLLKEFGVDNNKKDKLTSECKQCRSIKGEKDRQNNPDYHKNYHKAHAKEVSTRVRQWQKDNPEKEKEKINKWKEDNPERARAIQNRYQKKRKKNDPIFKLNANMSNMINRSLMGKKGGRKWLLLVDYDIEELMAHLESKFTEGMTWNNYGRGGWVIDHVIAKCHFNITSAECQEFKDCWSLDNLQPLWEIRNKEKSDKPMEPKYLIKPF